MFRNEPLVTIILPVYNTGELLRDTFESIINQTYKNIELIIVDDGSNEETRLIVDELGKTDRRVSVVHKENSGTCATRNIGLQIAKGEYVTFCDHDDIYTSDLIKKEVSAIQQNDYDIVVVGKKYVYENGTSKKFSVSLECKDSNESKVLFLKLIANQTASTVWNILYKKSTIDKLLFDETIKKGQEDIDFNLGIVENVNSFISMDECLYLHYLRNNMSTSASLHWETLDSMNKMLNKMVDVMRKINIKDDKLIVQLQGEMLRNYVMYAIKLGINSKRFYEMVSSLNYIYVKVNPFQINSKESFVYYMLVNRKLRQLYYVIKTFVVVKRLRRG